MTSILHRFARFICASLIIILACQAGAAYDLPDMGDPSSTTLSLRKENQIGFRIMQQIRSMPEYNHDLLAADYIETLGGRLAAEAHAPSRSFSFFVLNDGVLNAFALPGGYIGVHTGLILTANTEDELAGVLSHEIAHVTQRHIARMVERAKKMSLPTLATLLGAAILTVYNPAAGQALMAGTMAGTQQASINFTRQNEEEADRIGIDTLARAGYDPNGLGTFFARMSKANQYNENFAVPEILRTHPVNTSRIAEAQNRAHSYPPAPPHSQLHFQLIQERLRVLATKQSHGLLDHYQAALKNPKGRDVRALDYGLALAHAKQSHFSNAIDIMTRLHTAAPEERIYIMTLAELYNKGGQTDKAVTTLNQALETYPNDTIMRLQLAPLLIDAKESKTAKTRLQEYLSLTNKPEPVAYQYLARAEGKLKNNKAAHAAQAEYFAALGYYKHAMQQIELALKAPPHDATTEATLKKRLQFFTKMSTQKIEI